ncbi:hypothetical protein C9374_010275 [Naegleria lovaniensis]|uniref:Tumor susceptibility gene 101 protein n=1 Tax=Naegleria lovaniensis TaxID=51637 RepID=A0AA88KGH5_NAELO|nr:uncharacterized protein C9374_010275 [Naegleria lovaniensis]KAG2374901.1 hypothetical protein C9374_010275 [Naegleria lovaniensis]
MSSSSTTQSVEAVFSRVNYPYASRVRNDVYNLLSNIPLIVNVAKLNGKDTMQLTGTKYNIPMTFWIVEMYPYHPPLCFVSPTPNMVIKQKHKHVSETGQCYLPYLSEWNPSSSDLYELVNQLSAIFGSDPPVYQKSGTTHTTTPSGSFNSPMMSSVTNYPPPFHPPTGTGGMSSSMYGTTSTTNPTYATTTPTYGATTNPPPFGTSYISGTTVYGVNPMSSSMYNLPPVPRPPTESELKEKLIAKVRQHLQNVTLKEYGAKIEAEFKTQNQLSAREKQLEVIEQRMKTELEQIEKDKENLLQKKASLEEWINNNENKPIDVDTIINPQDMQSKQILDLTSEDNAIDDVIYYLEKKLHAKQISLQEWLEQIRELSRQQFFKKALIKKMAQCNF